LTSPEDIFENFPSLEELQIWKLWWVSTENGESRTHQWELQRSLLN